MAAYTAFLPHDALGALGPVGASAGLALPRVRQTVCLCRVRRWTYALRMSAALRLIHHCLNTVWYEPPWALRSLYSTSTTRTSTGKVIGLALPLMYWSCSSNILLYPHVLVTPLRVSTADPL